MIIGRACHDHFTDLPAAVIDADQIFPGILHRVPCDGNFVLPPYACRLWNGKTLPEVDGVIPRPIILYIYFQIFPAVICPGKEEVVIQTGVVVITHPFLIGVIHDRLGVHRGFGINVIGNARFGFKVIIVFLPCVVHRTGNRNIFFQFFCPVKAHNLIMHGKIWIPVELRLAGTV